MGKFKLWAKRIGLAILGFLAVMAAVRSGEQKRRANAAENDAANLRNQHTKKALDKAVALEQKAAAHAGKAALAKEKAEARIDEIAKNDDDIASLVNDWNTDRLRK